MAYFAVVYQLNKNKDYQPLWDALNELRALKPMRDFYLVDTNYNAKGLRDHLASFIDDDDFIFVSRLESKPFKQQCWKGTQDWINARFD
ncbi:hypothetical protein [Neorhizobium galegae]|uniref:hypothetical protein n=1 Tax=Neorhizobium galegae TaxID=399 RepID=UPI0012740AAA|nr:hypothetical protein [Neorhizobium galegae]KAA9383267.1 hypothetical protein F4V88_23325 [Neorhizobium galegae]MCM2500393.1 hypothetical protein [Neorhizobium galegae]